MPICIGVAFKRVAKSYWYDPAGLELAEDERVIVETTRGAEIGTVKIGAREIPEHELQGPLKRVLRRAAVGDLLHERQNREKAKRAMAVCLERVEALRLPMKLLQAEYSFDGLQVTVYFAADARVDFRELVREVAAQLRCKVQLHQVGPRDQAKMIGGVGPCGLTLCCATFLTDFAPISMKMAKDQSLFLNPVKFSGVCGKLMCCLRYEHDTYAEVDRRLPLIGEIVMSPRGQGKVLDVDVKREIALVCLIDGGAEIEFACSDLRIEKTTKCTDCRGCSVHKLAEDDAEAVKVDDEVRSQAARIAAERARTFERAEMEEADHAHL
ncbi:MAG TPA: stage 0 sporulation family protein [Chthonomonadaceae bacterium]|nr:stage 0 sporulation family protein [Chthonomonadaceae bacterium]